MAGVPGRPLLLPLQSSAALLEPFLAVCVFVLYVTLRTRLALCFVTVTGVGGRCR